MARHGENIYKRKDGRYEGRYVTGKKSNGTTRFGYVYGMRYTDVKKRLLEKKGRDPANHPSGGGCAWHDSGKMDAKLVGNGFAWGNQSLLLSDLPESNEPAYPAMPWTNANGIHHA